MPGLFKVSRELILVMSFFKGEKTYIIAEAGVNHNGDLSRAIDLCLIARDAGCDAVKFQTWKTEKIVVSGAPKAKYQELNSGSSVDQYSMLKELELSWNDFIALKGKCDEIGLDFLSTPDEEFSLAFLVNTLGLDTIKIGSGEILNVPLLRDVGNTAKSVILSTGMSSLSDVEVAVNALDMMASSLTLLHCTSQYPCPNNKVNLLAMETLRKKFGVKVGYSDHTLGVTASLAAVALGAKVIEKHFTQDKGLKGPDHVSSLEPHELSYLVKEIRAIEDYLGQSEKDIQDVEIDTKANVIKTITASKKIACGDIIDSTNIRMMRNGGRGLPGTYWDEMIGTVACQDFNLDDPIVKRKESSD